MTNIYNSIKDILEENEELFEMANLSAKETGLKVNIWSDGGGKFRQKKDHKPRVKIGKNDILIASVGLDDDVTILAKVKGLKASDLHNINEARKYIKKNLDIFRKHYNSHSNIYDDTNLRKDLGIK